MKIEQFLKGSTMNIKFNTAQLSRPQRLSLLTVLDVMQSENASELEVTPVEFPQKLRVKLDDDVDMLLGWDVDKQSYAGLTTPKTIGETLAEPESKKDTVDLPESGTLEVDLPGPAKPELDLAPVLERATALANAFVKLAKPLNNDQRQEIWIRFNAILFKELLG